MKEQIDANIIDAGVKSISDFKNDDLVPHFIYCGSFYFWTEEVIGRLKEILLTKMKSNGIQFAIFTELNMYRRKLVTKETVKKAYQGKLRNHEEWKYQEESINNDLETFFSNLQGQKKIKNEYVPSFFTPKLTAEELKLVDERNEEFLSTYSYHPWSNPDVDAEEMKKSDSKSKFVQGTCWRVTIPLTLESKQATDDKLTNTER